MLKLLRTLQLDPSDTFVFARTAEPGEWAVTGSFLFWDADPAKLSGKSLAAFRSGFVGVRTLGFATLVAVTRATEVDREEAVESLATHFVEKFSAPDRETARAAARSEIDFAASLCSHPLDTLVALHRRLKGSDIHEQFRVLQPRDAAAGADRLHAFARAFTIVEGEDDPPEPIDLMNLKEDKRR